MNSLESRALTRAAKPLLNTVQSLARAVAEVGRQVKDMRVPSAEFLREQAQKIADFKSPGMWVLMGCYQSFADQLKAEAKKEASPDQAMSGASAGATPEPEAAVKVISAFHEQLLCDPPWKWAAGEAEQ